MNYIYQGNPAEGAEAERNGLVQLLGELEAGDCLAVAKLSGAADSAQALLEFLDGLQARGIRFRAVDEGLDTGTPEGQCAVKLLRAALALDGGQKEYNDGAPAKGRKPIEIDEELFDQILERWKNGEITARQAMAELNLKPNTFYRRVKEREGKSGESILDAAKNLGKEIVNTVTEGTEELQKAAGKYDLASITDTVKKNISAAGKVFSSRMDSLSKDFQEAMKKQEAKQAAKEAAAKEAAAQAEAAQEAAAGEEQDAEASAQAAQEAGAAAQAPQEAAEAAVQEAAQEEQAAAEPQTAEEAQKAQEEQEPQEPEYL